MGTFSFSLLWYGAYRPELGACHADDLLYLFSSEPNWLPGPLVTEKDKEVFTLADRMLCSPFPGE